MPEKIDPIGIADLIIRKITDAGGMSEQEKQEFENWLSLSEENKDYGYSCPQESHIPISTGYAG